MLILLTALLVTGCGGYTAQNNASPKDTNQRAKVKSAYQKLDQSTAKENLNSNEAIILVDVRTPEEFEETRIPDSILVPDYEIEKLAPEMLPDKEALIYIYCRSGNRSKSAAKMLVDMGYTNVYDIGGIIDWEYETISGKE
ncbi:MAG: rhodanese-like protein [Clostridia bacterium]|nr:rhodanese-like protein [Clostridia bacterium]